MLEISYGFHCTCVSCKVLEQTGPVPSTPTGDEARAVTAKKLHEYMASNPSQRGLLRPVPEDLRCFLSEDYIATLSEQFSAESHEGSYDSALQAGLSLLDVYRLIYPENYPQIGMFDECYVDPY